VGVELARRTRSSNRDDADFGPPLAALCEEIEADRRTLEQAMEALGVARGRVKPAAGWLGEKLGRLKLNGQLTGYSPLSRLVELEGLQMGVTGKLQMWEALARTVGSLQTFSFEDLAARAKSQRQTLVKLQLMAASRALPSPGSSP
jgi:hypothetical protein